MQGTKATSKGQRFAAISPAMNNIRPAQILALLATGLGAGTTAALMNQENQQQQPAMANQLSH